MEVMLMTAHVTGTSSPPTSDPIEVDTPFPLPIDGDVFVADWHATAVHPDPVVGCVLCETTLRPKSCGCGVFVGESCDCEAFAASARGVFASNRVIMCRPAREWNV
jgi:hypothetical protein